VSQNLGRRLIAGGEAEAFVEIDSDLLELGSGVAVGRTLSGDPLTSDRITIHGDAIMKPIEPLEGGLRMRVSIRDDLFQRRPVETIDAYAAYRPFGRAFELRAAIRNLTDSLELEPDTIALPGAPPVGVPSLRRTFFIGAEGSL